MGEDEHESMTSGKELENWDTDDSSISTVCE
jgi:hypothetical protein